mmetsp:Transcript_27768/g.60324  ORF Transcript_27768/g.60324 Transcript_27768/m.60324 type:complete len:204 (-) Transcript_27768:927-1538(-)
MYKYGSGFLPRHHLLCHLPLLAEDQSCDVLFQSRFELLPPQPESQLVPQLECPFQLLPLLLLLLLLPVPPLPAGLDEAAATWMEAAVEPPTVSDHASSCTRGVLASLVVSSSSSSAPSRDEPSSKSLQSVSMASRCTGFGLSPTDLEINSLSNSRSSMRSSATSGATATSQLLTWKTTLLPRCSSFKEGAKSKQGAMETTVVS